MRKKLSYHKNIYRKRKFNYVKGNIKVQNQDKTKFGVAFSGTEQCYQDPRDMEKFGSNHLLEYRMSCSVYNPVCTFFKNIFRIRLIVYRIQPVYLKSNMHFIYWNQSNLVYIYIFYNGLNNTHFGNF